MTVTPMVGPEAEGKKQGVPVWVIALVACGVGGGLCVILGIVAAIAIPNLIGARKGANEAAAIGNLRTLGSAQALFREGDKDRNGTLDYASSLGALASVHPPLVDSLLGSGTKQGYVFTIEHADEFQWSGTATPVSAGKTGDRSFFIDESGINRWREARQGKAGAGDKPIGMP